MNLWQKNKRTASTAETILALLSAPRPASLIAGGTGLWQGAVPHAIRSVDTIVQKPAQTISGHRAFLSIVVQLNPFVESDCP